MVKNLKYSVGLDISKDNIHACVSVIDEQQSVKVISSKLFINSNKGFIQMDTWIKKYHLDPIPLVIIMEATGVYYEQAAVFFHKSNRLVSVILPIKAKKYMQAIGYKSKNDKIDAAGLSRMGAEQQLEVWQPMGDFFYQLRHLTRHHQSLQESITGFKNQLHAIEHSAWSVKEVIAHLKKTIKLFETQVEQTKQAITKLICTDEEVRQRVDHICMIKGVGLMTSATIIAETNGFALFKNIRQLVSYAGYDVIENQSGKHFGKTKISKRGNSKIRRILYLPAINAVMNKQKPFAQLFNRVYEKTGIKMKGYVAVQKKMLYYIYTLWKRNEPFIFDERKTSGNEESKAFFLLGSEGADIKHVVPLSTNRTTQDKPPSNVVARSLLSAS